MSAEDREGEGLVPGTLMYDVVGVDFYGELLQTLEKVGRFVRGTPGQPVGSERRRYYVLLYDWRKDNLVAVRKLHALIEQIRVDYGDPDAARGHHRAQQRRPDHQLLPALRPARPARRRARPRPGTRATSASAAW